MIAGVTISPPSGLQDRTLFTFAVNATDPDGDALTYSWDIAGNTATGQTVTMTFVTGGESSATVSVTDGKGGAAQLSQGFTVATMSGAWTGDGPWGPFTMTLTQTAGFIQGTYTDQFGAAQVGPTGELGTIDNTGNISLRVKQAPFADFTMKGTLEGSGRRATGTVSGSGASGAPFVMVKGVK
ncbi:MAG: PKD domain-containing protein [Acidobacteria bacterium]|nr:PKD domain-containing protein [Acidobacteriota bacterium]